MIFEKIAEKVKQKHAAYRKLMDDTSIPPVTVGQIRKICSPHEFLYIYRCPFGWEEIEYLIKCKENKNIDNQYDNCIVEEVIPGHKSSSLTLIIK